MELVSRMLAGDTTALARLISLAEEDSQELPYIMELITGRVGKAYCIGITGIPGGGKSSLVDRLTATIRSEGLSVGIIAVDPSSPFSGGALLGDRLRMQQHYTDRGVFIRSMATRGAQGGFPHTVSSVAKLLDASGKDYIIIETVGVGQTEFDIMKIADTTLVVLTPEAGDAIQSLKAGLMEIADIFVVNKADRPDAEQMVQNLLSATCSSPRHSWWQIPVVATQAINNLGLGDLWTEIARHRLAKEETGDIDSCRKERRCQEFRHRVEQGLSLIIGQYLNRSARFAEYMKSVEEGETNPLKAALEVLEDKTFWDDWFAHSMRSQKEKNTHVGFE